MNSQQNTGNLQLTQLQQSQQPPTQQQQQNRVYAFSLFVFIFIWVMIGFIAFITSIVCFTKSGTTLDKALGLLLALFFGPLYFLFFAFNDNYCK